MTIAPDRDTAVWLGWTLSMRVPSPWPEDGEMLIQLASLVAVHVHSRAAATEIFTWPPPAATVGADVGNSVAQRTVLGPVISVTEVPPHATERESAVTKSPNRQVSRRCTAGADASQVPAVLAKRRVARRCRQLVLSRVPVCDEIATCR